MTERERVANAGFKHFDMNKYADILTQSSDLSINVLIIRDARYGFKQIPISVTCTSPG